MSLAVIDILEFLSLVGVFVFAVSGALQALRQDMDFVGVAFIACLTGVGGGTLRDLLLGATPVGWVTNPTDIFVCIAGTIIVGLLYKRLQGNRMQFLIWADAAGLALFAVLGTEKALNFGAHPFIAILFGAMSATFGGIIRDIICNETPVLFRREVYITPTLAGAASYILLQNILGMNASILAAIILCFILRACAIRWSWSLPSLGGNSSSHP